CAGSTRRRRPRAAPPCGAPARPVQVEWPHVRRERVEYLPRGAHQPYPAPEFFRQCVQEVRHFTDLIRTIPVEGSGLGGPPSSRPTQSIIALGQARKVEQLIFREGRPWRPPPGGGASGRPGLAATGWPNGDALLSAFWGLREAFDRIARHHRLV